MTLAERIKAAREALIVKKDQLVELTKQLDETPDDDNVLTQVDELSAQVQKDVDTLEKLEKAESALAERAKAAPAIITNTTKVDTKDLWIKHAVCNFIAHINRSTPEAVAAERYKGNTALDAVMKSAVLPATTFTAGWAAELARTDVQGFVDLITPTSVFGALSSRTQTLNFDGFTSITVPKRGARGAFGANMAGAFVGEAGAIPLGKMTLGSAVIAMYKLAVISTFTRELASRSTPSIESVIRNAIVADMSIELDAHFLDNVAAVTGIRPAGIANGLTALTGTAGGGPDAVIADLQAAFAEQAANGYGGNLVILLNTQDALAAGMMQTAVGGWMFRDELNNGRLGGAAVITSLNVPKGTMYTIEPSALALVLDGPNFDVSDVASVVEANADTTAPTHANGGAAGAVGTAGQVPRSGGIGLAGTTGTASTGFTARSLWQTYSIGIRAVLPVSWGVVGNGGVTITTGLTW